jgi:hypothetical protein
MRNFGFAGAATCLVILVGLAQVGAKELPLKISVLSASVALPMWLLLGSTYEAYIFLGKQSYPHYRSPFVLRFVLAVFGISGFCTVVATSSVIWFLMPVASCAFMMVGVIAVCLFYKFYSLLAEWWFAPNGPGSENNESDV